MDTLFLLQILWQNISITNYVNIMLNRIANWILLSSKNYGEGSLMAKGALIGMIPVIISALSLANINVASSDLADIINGFFSILSALATLVAIIVTTVGAIRKVYLTATDQNISVR